MASGSDSALSALEFKRDPSVWVPQIVLNLALIAGWLLHRISFETFIFTIGALQVPATMARRAKTKRAVTIDGAKLAEGTVTPVIPPAEIDLAKVSSEPPQSTS